MCERLIKREDFMERFCVSLSDFKERLKRAVEKDDDEEIRHLINDFFVSDSAAYPKRSEVRPFEREGRW
jgi:hypothetical protein